MGEMINLEVLNRVRESQQEHVTKALIDTLESMGYDAENLGVSLYIKDNSKVKWKPKSHFIKLYPMELKKVKNKTDLTMEELGVVTLLSTYASFEDCFIRNDDGSFMSQQDMIDVMGFKRTKAHNILKRLQEFDVLLKGRQPDNKRKNRYFINPNLFYVGSEINLKVKEYYDKKKIIDKQKKEEETNNT